MEYLNTGKYKNDGESDTIKVAAEKINKNFKELNNKLRVKEPLKTIVWKTLADTKQAMDNVNYNFKVIEETLDFNCL